MSRQPKLRIVEVVTREHGERFADELRVRSIGSGEVSKAFLETGVVLWPDNRLAHIRFHDIEEAITGRIFDELKEAVVESFTRDRERSADPRASAVVRTMR